MPNSGSCDRASAALDGLSAQRALDAASRLPLEPGQTPDLQRIKGVARDFASLLYTALFKQMQQTVRQESDEDEGSALKEGVLDMMAMYLPKTIAGQSQDALTRAIYQQLKARYGGRLDEQA